MDFDPVGQSSFKKGYFIKKCRKRGILTDLWSKKGHHVKVFETGQVTDLSASLLSSALMRYMYLDLPCERATQ